MEEEVGRISHYFSKIGVAVIEVMAGRLKVGDTIHIKGHTSDFTQKVESLQQEHLTVPEAKKGMSVGLKVMHPVREHDAVFVVTGALSAMSREAAHERLRGLGAEIGSSVSKKTTCVVVGENPGSKADRAKALRVKTIGEAEFLELVGGRG